MENRNLSLSLRNLGDPPWQNVAYRCAVTQPPRNWEDPMARPPSQHFREAILAWLGMADEEELIEVLDVIQAQLSRRWLRVPRLEAPEANQEREEEPR